MGPTGSMYLMRLLKLSPNNYRNGLCVPYLLGQGKGYRHAQFQGRNLALAKMCSTVSTSLFLSSLRNVNFPVYQRKIGNCGKARKTQKYIF